MRRREAALAAVAREVAACTRCAELAATRTQTVFGVGNPHARLVFCGEAPGADEDRMGEPFVGRAGQLLTDIIVKGMKMRREDVYILNILRCRPPGTAIPCPSKPPIAASTSIGNWRLSNRSSSVVLGRWRLRTCWERTFRSAGSAAGFTTFTASRSSARITLPMCCEIRRPSNSSGRTFRC